MDVVWCSERHRCRRLAHRDGDGLAVGQLHHQVRTGDFVVHRRGVSHHAALDHALRGGQGHRGGVDGIGDLGHGRSAADLQFLEIATGGAGNGHAQVFGIDIHIVAWCIDGDRRFLRAGRNGDRLAIAQLDHQVGAGLVGQGGGVGDLATFSHGVRRGQGERGDVRSSRIIGDSRHRLANRHGLLVVAARDVGDLVGQVQVGVVDVVRRGERHRSRRLAHWNGNGLAVGQLHHQVRTGDFVVHRRGVSHHAAFSDSRSRGQGDRSGVDGVGDLGHSRSAADLQFLEIATGGAGNGHAQVFGIDVHVVAWGIDGDRRFLRAGGDGDGFTVAQLDDQVGTGLVGQSSGVGDFAAFSDSAGGAEA
ncbi:hypothetical protein D3C76_583720 [compost metagenome]